MANILSAVRVNEVSSDTSSPYTLDGKSTAQKNLRTFAGASVDGEEVFIAEVHRTVDDEWQISRATITDASPDTYVINQVIDSATGSQISWTAGDRDVFLIDLHGYSPGPQHTVTDDTTVNFQHLEVLGNFSTLKTVTLPPVANYQGKWYWFKSIGSATMKIAEDSGDSSTIEALSGSFGTSLNLTRAGQGILLRSDGTKWRRLSAFDLAIGADVAASTSGSILYIDSNNDLAQDNSNLFYDATNKRVGLLTASPSYPLDIDLTASPADTKAARATIGADNDDGWRCEGTITGTGRPFNAVLDCSDRVICSIQNTNTGGGHAAFEAITASGSGDPRLDLTVSGEQAWTLGIDNSDSNKFKLAAGSTLGANTILIADTSSNVGIVGEATAPRIYGQRAEGTLASPTAVGINDRLLELRALAYGDTQYHGPYDHFYIEAAETWTDSANGTYVVIETVEPGTQQERERLRVQDDKVLITTAGATVGRLELKRLVATSGSFDAAQIGFYNGTNEVTQIAGGVDSALDAGTLSFLVRPTGGSLTRSMFIDSDGRIELGSGSAPAAQLYILNQVASDPALEIRGHASQSDDIFRVRDSAATDYFIIDSIGLVGVNKGASAPAARFDISINSSTEVGQIINQPATHNVDVFQVTDNSDTVQFAIDNNYSIASGVTAPSGIAAIHIHRANNFGRVHFTTDTSGTTTDDGFFVGIDGANKLDAAVWNKENAVLRFATNDTERATFLGTGEYGLNTTTPTSLFELDYNVNNSPDDTKALAIVNTAAAVANVSGDDGQSYSPALRWEGQGWKTDATAASQSVEFRQYLQPIQGAAAPTAKLLLEASINGGAYSSLLDISSGGTLFLTEQAAAIADVAGKGQLWVRNDTPNVLVFTDDAGTDTVLGAGGGSPGGADTELQFNNSGAFGGISSVTWNGTTLGVDNAAVFNESGADVDFRVEGSGSANALFVQGSDGFVGIGTPDPEGPLDLTTAAAAKKFYLTTSNIAHGFTAIVPTDVTGTMGDAGANGGILLQGFSQAAAAAGFVFEGNIGTTGTPTDAPLVFKGLKRTGTTTTDVGDNQFHTAFSKKNGTQLITIVGNGRLGCNVTGPGARIHANTNAATEVGMIIKATAGQTAALTQWQTSTPTTVLSVLAGGNLSFGEGINIVTGTTTGTKIGTATSQKLGFFNATPIIQPTTGVAEASFVENAGGTAVNVDSTFGGYTLQQIAQALQNLGLLT